MAVEVRVVVVKRVVLVDLWEGLVAREEVTRCPVDVHSQSTQQSCSCTAKLIPWYGGATDQGRVGLILLKLLAQTPKSVSGQGGRGNHLTQVLVDACVFLAGVRA